MNSPEGDRVQSPSVVMRSLASSSYSLSVLQSGFITVSLLLSSGI